jgi:hypothetical protein
MWPETFNFWVSPDRILCRHQRQFSINVWAGIFGDCLVGPHILPHGLTGNHYRDSLLHEPPKQLEDVPLGVRARMWYMYDGASAHFSRAVRDVLSNTHHARRIGRGGPTPWSPRSPDFNPLDFYLWEHLKPRAYAAPDDNEETLHHLMWMLVRLSATTPTSLCGCGGPWWDVSRRVLNLMEDILNTYYKCIDSAITQKLNVSGHMLIWTLFLVFVCGTRARGVSASFT